MEEGKRAAQKAPAYAWLILLIVFLASFIAPMAQFKVTTLSDPLMAAFSLDPASFGWLMSSLTVCGVLLAIPAAWMCGKMGEKTAILVSVACIGVGSLIGAVTDSAALLFLSRAIEGCGIAFIGVAAPTALSMWFPEGSRALPLAIWCTWMPLGSTVSMLIVPPVADAFGWRGAWWMCVICAVVVFVLVLALFRAPAQSAAETAEQSVEAQKGFFMRGLGYLKNKEIWLLCIAFFCFNFICNGVFMSYYPMYLQNGMGLTNAAAGQITSIMPILTIVIMPIMGILYDRLGHRKPFVMVAFGLCAATLAIAFMGSIALVWVSVIVFGCMGGLVASGTRPMTPEIMEKRGGGALAVAMGMSVMQISQNLAPTIGSPLFGAMMMDMGWLMASLVLCVPLALVALVAMAFIKVR